MGIIFTTEFSEASQTFERELREDLSIVTEHKAKHFLERLQAWKQAPNDHDLGRGLLIGVDEGFYGGNFEGLLELCAILPRLDLKNPICVTILEAGLMALRWLDVKFAIHGQSPAQTLGRPRLYLALLAIQLYQKIESGNDLDLAKAENSLAGSVASFISSSSAGSFLTLKRTKKKDLMKAPVRQVSPKQKFPTPSRARTEYLQSYRTARQDLLGKYHVENEDLKGEDHLRILHAGFKALAKKWAVQTNSFYRTLMKVGMSFPTGKALSLIPLNDIKAKDLASGISHILLRKEQNEESAFSSELWNDSNLFHAATGEKHVFLNRHVAFLFKDSSAKKKSMENSNLFIPAYIAAHHNENNVEEMQIRSARAEELFSGEIEKLKFPQPEELMKLWTAENNAVARLSALEDLIKFSIHGDEDYSLAVLENF